MDKPTAKVLLRLAADRCKRSGFTTTGTQALNAIDALERESVRAFAEFLKQHPNPVQREKLDSLVNAFLVAQQLNPQVTNG